MQSDNKSDNELVDGLESELRRNLLAAIAAGAALGAVPGMALAQSYGAAATATRAAMPSGLQSWATYVDLLKPAGALIDLTWEPKSEQTRAELYRQLVMNIAQGYFMYFQADPEHPDWMPFENSVFMLQPNPDGVYHLALIRGDRQYRITGYRGNNRVMGFAVGKHMIGMADPVPGFNNYDADGLTLGADGRFDVTFSKERPAGYKGDWRFLHPEAEFIMIRQFSYDWGNDQEARFAIECLDAQPLKPRPSKEEIAAKLDLLLGGYVRRLSKLAIDVDNEVYNRGFVNKMEFTNFMGNSDEWPQIYWRTIFDCKPGEALIIETELPKKCKYWNVQLNDSLWNQVEFAYRQSSLNAHQAKLDADGKFRAVIALEDPGVPNWLDPGEFQRGMLVGRWHGADSHPMPTIGKVAFADIRKHLPANTPKVTPEERNKVLRARNIGTQLRRRW